MSEFQIQKKEWISIALLLTAMIFLFWWRIWAPTPADRMHFSDDIEVKDYPTRLGLFRLWVEEDFPLWDTYQMGGWPGFANCEAGMLYPLNWLLIPFVNAPEFAFQVTQWTVLLHFLIAGLGAYCFARYWGLSVMASTLTAVAYTFCGFHCAHKKHTNMLYALVWLPWLWWQLERWLGEKRLMALVWLTLLFSLAVLAGHPQAALFMGILLAARTMHAGLSFSEENLSAHWAETLFKKTVPVFAALGLVVLITAAQWLPLWELIQQGHRAGADTFQQSTEFSLPPIELIDAVLPEALRNGSQVEVFSWGSLPLLLACFGLVYGTFRSLERFMTVTAIAAVLLALGHYFFLYELIYNLIPGVAWVRAPSRWIYFAGLPIAYFAGLALDELFNPINKTESLRRFALKLMLAWLAAIVFCAAIALWQDEGDAQRRILQILLLQVLFSGLLFLGLHVYFHERLKSTGLAIFIVLLTWVELGTHYNTLDLQPGPGGHAMDSKVQSIHEAPWNQRTKVFFGAGGIRDRYHGAAQDFRELDGQSPLTPVLQQQLRQDTAIHFPRNYNAELLRMLGVGTVLTDHQSLAPPYQQAGEERFIVKTPPVRARFYTEWMNVAPQAQRELLKLQSFPFDQLLLRGPQPEVAELEPGDEKEEAESEEKLNEQRLFPKPFVLASVSIRGITPKAMLVVDGEDQFAELGDTPGYYVAVADATTGEIENSASFNLMSSYNQDDTPAHREFAAFIDAVSPGKIVLAAVADNAANVLLKQGLRTLRKIGAGIDIRDGHRYAHLVIGRKGAPVGSAVELFSPTEALVVQSENLTAMQGIRTATPQPTWYTDTQYPVEWLTLYEAIYREANYTVHYQTDAGPEAFFKTPPMPIAVFSSPKQQQFQSRLLSVNDRAAILVGGRDVSPNQVGYNLVVMHPKTFEILDKGSFNLLNDIEPQLKDGQWVYPLADPPKENLAMQEFIQSVTDGYIVMGAIRDEATDVLLPNTVQALRTLGSNIDIDVYNDPPESRKHIGHAFVGIKGATHCYEVFKQAQDVLVFTRYPGGPMLKSNEDFKTPPADFDPEDPMNEAAAHPHPASSIIGAVSAPVWEVKENGPNHLAVSGVSEQPGVLFVNELYYPGWKAARLGFTTPVERVNYFFRGVALPAGGYVVEFVYDPRAFRIGLWLSLAGVLILFLWITWVRLPPRR